MSQVQVGHSLPPHGLRHLNLHISSLTFVIETVEHEDYLLFQLLLPCPVPVDYSSIRAHTCWSAVVRTLGSLCSILEHLEWVAPPLARDQSHQHRQDHWQCPHHAAGSDSSCTVRCAGLMLVMLRDLGIWKKRTLRVFLCN